MLTLGTSLIVDDGAKLQLNGGTLSAQSISSNNNGYLSGYGTVGGAVSGGVVRNSGWRRLAGSGLAGGDQGNFDYRRRRHPRIEQWHRRAGIFDGTSATLKLDAPAAFTGAIEDLVVGDAIDLAGITASSANYSGTTLTINETNGQQLIYGNVTGNLAGDAVMVASDNNGGTARLLGHRTGGELGCCDNRQWCERYRCWSHSDYHGRYQCAGDGDRHTDIATQRQRGCDLHHRLGYERADIHLQGAARRQHVRSSGDWAQPPVRCHYPRCGRQQSVGWRDCRSRHPDRYHAAVAGNDHLGD